MSSLFFFSNGSGGPIVITLPHMLNTAPEYSTVSGLHPNEDKHLIFADIEPVCINHCQFLFPIFAKNPELLIILRNLKYIKKNL